MNGVIASVELDDARNDLETRVSSGRYAEEANDEVEAGDDKAEFLARGRPGSEGDAEQEKAKDQMGEIVSERVMVFVMTAGDVKEGKDPKDQIENA